MERGVCLSTVNRWSDQKNALKCFPFYSTWKMINSSNTVWVSVCSHIVCFYVNVARVSGVHDVSELTTVPIHLPVHSVMHCTPCACSGRLNQWLEVTGGVYRVSRGGVKWSRIFYLAPLSSILPLLLWHLFPECPGGGSASGLGPPPSGYWYTAKHCETDSCSSLI